MPSPFHLTHAVYRLTLKRGSPQRIPYSRSLTAGALLVLVLLAITVPLLAFGQDLIGVILYLFTTLSALYLGTAFLSRRTPPSRLRTGLQAMLVLLAAAHLPVLLTAPLAGMVPWLPYAVAAAAGAAVVMGLINCVHFALARARSTAIAWTVAFVFAAAGFYATMAALLAVALA